MSRKQTRQVTAQKDRRRGVYVLRWKNRYGARKQEATEIRSTDGNYKKAVLAAQAKERELSGGSSSGLVTWLEFQMEYEREYLASLSRSSRKKWDDTVRRVNEFLDPIFVSDIDSRALSRLNSELQTATHGRRKKKPLAQATIDGYFRTLLASLAWAAEMQMIDAVPKFRIAKQKARRAKKRKSKGRSLTLEEHERMKTAAKAHREHQGCDDADMWIELLEHLWASGLRISEQLELSWDWSDRFAVSIDVKYPRYVIDGDAQKSGKSELLPIAPEYVEILLRADRSEREGRVLDWQWSEGHTIKTISDFGKRAKIKVNSSGKNASAHDYRRTFGTRWAPKIAPADLQKLMRHASITTTMEYYVDMPADELGARLWQAAEKESDVDSAKAT